MSRSQGLKDLAALREALERQRLAAAAEQERLHEAALRERAQAHAFQAAVGPVHRLKDRRLAEVDRPRPEAVAWQRALDEQAALRSAWSDELDVDSLLETDDALSFRRPDIAPDVLRRLRRGQWAIQAHMDLHGMTRDQARERLSEFVRDASQRGLRCVRVVHGKGLGSPGRTPVLKAKVRAWLVQRNDVAAFTQARPAEGGAGALVVLLRGG